jgi:hypothetical protein
MKDNAPSGRRVSMSAKRRQTHNPEQIVAKTRDADEMLNTRTELPVLLQAVEISDDRDT